MGRRHRHQPENSRAWNLEVITIDPKNFQGQLAGSFGPDLEKRETTSQLATDARAIAAVDAGYFVFDPAAGAEGDPAGVGVYGGKTLSEPVADRPALVIDGKKNSTSIQRLTWAGSVSSASGSAALDGTDRVPGPDPQLRRSQRPAHPARTPQRHLHERQRTRGLHA